MSTTARRLVVPTSERHSVTTLELFFDLVFVFAITQVTAFMAEDLGWRGMARGLVMLALLWWAWCSYAWLGNQAKADEGIIRAAMMSAMAAMFLVALAIPEAWDGDRNWLAPVLLASGLAVVRLGHLGVYAVASLDDSGLRHQLARTAVPVTIAAALLVTGAVVGGTAQTALWLTALVVDYGGIYAAGSDWRLPAPRHFAERHGLIMIIALGESLIAVGVGMNDEPLTAGMLLVGLLAMAVTGALWWAYFDVVGLVAERVLTRAQGEERVRLARDSYTYLHFPMIAGIIYLALGLKKVAEYVADTEHHSLSDALPALALWSMYGGVVVYLVGHIAFRARNVGSVNVPRVVTAILLALAPVLLADAPALVALAVLAAVLTTLVAFEVLRYRDARHAVRHAQD